MRRKYLEAREWWIVLLLSLHPCHLFWTLRLPSSSLCPNHLWGHRGWDAQEVASEPLRNQDHHYRQANLWYIQKCVPDPLQWILRHAKATTQEYSRLTWATIGQTDTRLSDYQSEVEGPLRIGHDWCWEGERGKQSLKWNGRVRGLQIASFDWVLALAWAIWVLGVERWWWRKWVQACTEAWTSVRSMH